MNNHRRYYNPFAVCVTRILWAALGAAALLALVLAVRPAQPARATDARSEQTTRPVADFWITEPIPSATTAQATVEASAEPVALEPAPEPRSYNGITEGSTVTGTVTHYDVCLACCGKTDGITASGLEIRNGMENPYIVACNWLPFGSVLEINGMQYTVADRGGASLSEIGHVDIFVPEGHQAALELGRLRDVETATRSRSRSRPWRGLPSPASGTRPRQESSSEYSPRRRGSFYAKEEKVWRQKPLGPWRSAQRSSSRKAGSWSNFTWPNMTTRVPSTARGALWWYARTSMTSVPGTACSTSTPTPPVTWTNGLTAPIQVQHTHELLYAQRRSYASRSEIRPAGQKVCAD